MKLPPQEQIELLVNEFWEDVLKELKSSYREPASGEWCSEIDEFKSSLAKATSVSPNDGHGTQTIDAIYHENPADVARAIALGSFRKSPKYPASGDVIGALTESRERMGA